jgi:hypothetical protein
MPFSFPSSPTVGQTSTQNGRSYTYAGGSVWELTPSSGGGSGLTWSSVPASATATGTAGSIAYDGDFLYVAVGSNQWERAALSTWSNDQFSSSVVLLMRGDGNLSDSSSYARTVTAYGNAAATGTAKFGSASLTFDGDGDYLTAPSSSSLDLGDNYTVEAWVRPASSNLTGGIVHRGTYYSSGNGALDATWAGLQCSIRCLGTDIRFYFRATTNANEQYLDIAQSYFPASTWTHMAMVRNGTTGYVFAGGVLAGTVTGLGSSTTGADPIYIGTWPAVGNGSMQFAGYFNGQIDDLRITKAARYVSAFTPTAEAFPNP